MSATTELETYRRRREAFWAHLLAGLEAAPAVVAAWLTGSHGRDEDDLWSDFDLQVAVRDADAEELLADPAGLFALGGEPLLVQAGFPSDSIPSGKFWLVVYAGPVFVDWNVGPMSTAARPEASRLLFSREPVPVTMPVDPISGEELRMRAQQTLDFFWAMAPIAAKYAGRGWTARAVQQIDLLRTGYIALYRAAAGTSRGPEPFELNRLLEPEIDRSLPRLAESITAMDCLVVIRGYCQRVAALAPSLAAIDVQVDSRLPVEVERLITIAGTVAASGGSSPERGSRR